MLWIIVYTIILIGIGFFHYRKNQSHTVEDFTAYGRKAGGFSVGMSLTALIFGASSVFGLAGYASQFGLNAVWWTLSGAVFLVILAITFSDTVYSVRGLTISDIIAKAFGENIRFFTSLIIITAWTMILAGQIIAGGNILDLFLHNTVLSYCLFTLMFTIYTLLIGQAGAMKSGLFQVVLMIAGIIILLIIAFINPQANVSRMDFSFGFNGKFTPGLFLSVFIPVGLSYLFGPDMYSRIFTARDAKSAKKGVLIGSVLTAIICIMVVLIGIAGNSILGNIDKPDNLIPLLVQKFLSGPLANIVLLSLLSVPLSGADIMLITLGTLLGKDITYQGFRLFGRNEPGEKETILSIRIAMLIIAITATITALSLKGIIPSLLIAYKIFSIGIVPLVFAALLSIRLKIILEGKIRKTLMGIYFFISAAVVFATEMKWILIPIVNYNLYLLAFNTLILLGVLFWPKKKQNSFSS